MSIYNQESNYVFPENKKTNVCSVLAIVFGLIGIIPILNIIFLPIAIVLAIVGLCLIKKRKRGVTIASVIVVVISLSISILWIAPLFCASTSFEPKSAEVSNNISTDAMNKEEELINYLLLNGNLNKAENTYTISEQTNEAGVESLYSISYGKKENELLFTQSSYLSTGALIKTSMTYVIGSDEQNVSISMVMKGNIKINARGKIYLSSYSNSNKSIYSFESSYNNEEIKTICEDNVSLMLTHCTLLIIEKTGVLFFNL